MRDQTLRAKLLVESIPEFQYPIGDMRIHLLRHIVHSYPDRVTTYLTNEELTRRAATYSQTRMFRHLCQDGTRRVVPPSDESLRGIQKWQHAGEEGTPFLMFPFLAISKSACRDRPQNASVHAMFALYNRKRNELERIDLRKYLIKNFSIKPIYTKGFQTTLPRALKAAKNGAAGPNERCQVVSEHDVPVAFMERYGIREARYAYPLYMLAYLHGRCSYPEKSPEEIEELVVKRMGWTDIERYWNEWREACPSLARNCRIERVINTETNRCRKEVGLLGSRSKEGKKVEKVAARLGLEEVAPYTDVVHKATVFENLGTRAKTIAAVLFVMNKHKNGYLLPSLVKWNPSPEGDGGWKLGLPDGFWNSWREGMLDERVRFLVVLLSCRYQEGTGHANALLYDKETHEMERFDSLGTTTAKEYNLEGLDVAIRELFQKKEGTHVPTGMKYLSPMDYCPLKVRVFQSKELEFIGFEDLRGNCAVWRAWYIDARLANPHLPRDRLVRLAMKRLDETMPLTRFIKQYQMYLTQAIGAQ